MLMDQARLDRVALGLAPVGVLILAAGVLAAALHFHEPYLPWRNFVSELGCAGSTTWAWAFNASISLGSLFLLPLVAAFCANLGNRPAALGLWIAVMTMGAAVCLGFFPMDDLWPHLVVALAFFGGWLVLVPVVTIAVWQRHRWAKPAPLVAGLASELIGVVFLFVVFTGMPPGLTDSLGQAGAGQAGGPMLQGFRRPAIWDIAVLEWSLVASVLAWHAVAWIDLRLPAVARRVPVLMMAPMR